MTIGARCCLTLGLLAAAPFFAGCTETRAPAATNGADARNEGAASIDADPNQDVAVGLNQQGAFSADLSTEIRRDPAKNVRDSAADSPKTPTAPASSSAAPAPSRLPRGAGGTSDITFDTIKFQMEKTERYRSEMLTPAIHALAGRRIRVRGYILPSFQQTGITQFVLVRDNMQCCFGPGAALYDCIVVEMSPGKSTDFKVQPVTVEGTFSISELLDPDGKCLAIYHLAGESVR